MRSELSEKQAWKVAQVVFGFRTGLCRTIRQLQTEGLISAATATRMRARLGRYGKRHGLCAQDAPLSSYFFPTAAAKMDDPRIRLAKHLGRRA